MKKNKMEEMSEPNEGSAAEEKKDYEDHEVESAMHDIIRAHKHKKDKKMMAAVHKKMGDHQEAIGSMDDLKKARNDSFMKGQK